MPPCAAIKAAGSSRRQASASSAGSSRKTPRPRPVQTRPVPGRAAVRGQAGPAQNKQQPDKTGAVIGPQPQKRQRRCQCGCSGCALCKPPAAPAVPQAEAGCRQSKGVQHVEILPGPKPEPTGFKLKPGQCGRQESPKCCGPAARQPADRCRKPKPQQHIAWPEGKIERTAPDG